MGSKGSLPVKCAYYRVSPIPSLFEKRICEIEDINFDGTYNIVDVDYGISYTKIDPKFISIDKQDKVWGDFFRVGTRVLSTKTIPDNNRKRIGIITSITLDIEHGIVFNLKDDITNYLVYNVLPSDIEFLNVYN